MNATLLEAIRKESFVQGWCRAWAKSLGRELSGFADAEILAIVPVAEAAYVKFRAERGR